jgi:hypothetical protein
MDSQPSWYTPELSLATQCQQEIDRRRAVQLDQQDLQMLTDKLICDWYVQRELINRCLARIRSMEVQIALATAPPSKREPSQCHFQWARQIMNSISAK